MSYPQLDPQFQHYLSDKPSLTYVQESDKALRKLVINRLEIALGRRKIENVYHALKQDDFEVAAFFQEAVASSSIQINHCGVSPQEFKAEGPVVFLANHPFGIIDGMVLCNIATQIYGDMRILINSVLCQDKDLAPYFLPIDFDDTRNAIKTNIRSKQLALEAMADDVPVLIFPSGMVSTANKMGFGEVKDGPWTTFAAKLVRESKATVVPVHFQGRNSRKFHIASHIAEPLRMGMMMHEALNKFGSTVNVTIGQPLPWSELQQYADRKLLTKALYRSVQNLAAA